MTRKIDNPHKSQSLTGLKRELAELSTLYEVSKAIHSSTDLEIIMREIMDALHEKMGMERGTLTLLDQKTGELTIEIARGLESLLADRELKEEYAKRGMENVKRFTWERTAEQTLQVFKQAAGRRS